MMMLFDYSFYSPSGIAFLMLLAAIFFPAEIAKFEQGSKNEQSW